MHDSGDTFTVDDFTAEFITGEPTVPEPSTMVLALMGGLGCILAYRRRRRS
jgi:hypothetical protein